MKHKRKFQTQEWTFPSEIANLVGKVKRHIFACLRHNPNFDRGKLVVILQGHSSLVEMHTNALPTSQGPYHRWALIAYQ